MKRFALLASVLALVAGAAAVSQSTTKLAVDVQIEKEGRNPWTNLRWNNAVDTFHFAVVSDRTGGHRARIFSQAVDQLNLLQPAFVVSVGDLIEGYTKDQARLSKEWKEFQSYTNRLQMPFFYVPGNHDLANPVQVDEWKERFGRRYYHFIYHDVLFLCLATDDEGENDKNYGAISKEQVDYAQKVLKDNPNVRWTVVMLHKPIWDIERANAEGWLAIEKGLEGRKYTVFAGHMHRFHKFVRNGMNYYQLATTGGGSKMRGLDYGEVDHITWVTMKADTPPTISHILLDGILPENMKPVTSIEEGVVNYNRKPPQPVRGRLTYDGAAVAGAKVVFNLVEEGKDGKKKYSPTADAFTEADGSFVLSSYKAWDGCPAGEYIVAVVQREPLLDEKGKPGVNRLPARYGTASTSDLRVTVKAGENNIPVDLTP